MLHIQSLAASRPRRATVPAAPNAIVLRRRAGVTLTGVCSGAQWMHLGCVALSRPHPVSDAAIGRISTAAGTGTTLNTGFEGWRADADPGPGRCNPVWSVKFDWRDAAAAEPRSSPRYGIPGQTSSLAHDPNIHIASMQAWLGRLSESQPVQRFTFSFARYFMHPNPPTQTLSHFATALRVHS
jgi:hypothetical protein